MTEVIRQGPITIATNMPDFGRMLELAPEATAFHSRVMLGRWFATWQREWRDGLPPRLRRLQRRGSVLFFVDPKGRSDAQIRTALKNQPLAAISGKIWIRNEPALLLEFGGTVRPKNGNYLAIPAGRFRRMRGERRRAEIGKGPEDYRRRKLGNELFPLTRRRSGATRLVLGRQKRGTENDPKPKVESVYMLVRQARIQPQLGVRDSWAGQESYRARTAQEASDRITKDMAAAFRPFAGGLSVVA